MTALLSILPDVFVIVRKLMPIKKVKKELLKCHNTTDSIEKAYKINKKLGRAWEMHKEQDLSSHGGKYEYEPEEDPDKIDNND